MGPKVDSSRWVQKACRRAYKLGLYLGSLDREGIAVVSPTINWLGSVRYLISFKRFVNGRRVSLDIEARIAKALSDGYIVEKMKARGQPPLEDSDDDD